jgi:hypothetical protein
MMYCNEVLKALVRLQFLRKHKKCGQKNCRKRSQHVCSREIQQCEMVQGNGEFTSLYACVHSGNLHVCTVQNCQDSLPYVDGTPMWCSVRRTSVTSEFTGTITNNNGNNNSGYSSGSNNNSNNNNNGKAWSAKLPRPIVSGPAIAHPLVSCTRGVWKSHNRAHENEPDLVSFVARYGPSVGIGNDVFSGISRPCLSARNASVAENIQRSCDEAYGFRDTPDWPGAWYSATRATELSVLPTVRQNPSEAVVVVVATTSSTPNATPIDASAIPRVSAFATSTSTSTSTSISTATTTTSTTTTIANANANATATADATANTTSTGNNTSTDSTSHKDPKAPVSTSTHVGSKRNTNSTTPSSLASKTDCDGRSTSSTVQVENSQRSSSQSESTHQRQQQQHQQDQPSIHVGGALYNNLQLRASQLFDLLILSQQRTDLQVKNEHAAIQSNGVGTRMYDCSVSLALSPKDRVVCSAHQISTLREIVATRKHVSDVCVRNWALIVSTKGYRATQRVYSFDYHCLVTFYLSVQHRQFQRPNPGVASVMSSSWLETKMGIQPEVLDRERKPRKRGHSVVFNTDGADGSTVHKKRRKDSPGYWKTLLNVGNNNNNNNDNNNNQNNNQKQVGSERGNQGAQTLIPTTKSNETSSTTTTTTTTTQRDLKTMTQCEIPFAPLLYASLPTTRDLLHFGFDHKMYKRSDAYFRAFCDELSRTHASFSL